MPTVFDTASRNALVSRIDRLTADSRPAWGRMNVGQVVCHLSQSLRLATGELVCKPRGGLLSWTPLARLVIHKLPFPKGAPTAPELLDTVPAATLEEDRVVLRELLERVGRIGPDAEYPAHPAFGTLRGLDWGVLIYRHFDHHLRQFGV
jgi:hypothetical protein